MVTRAPASRRRSPLGVVPLWLLTLALGPATARAEGTDPVANTLRPLLARYCVDCHDADDPKGEIDLSALVDEPSLANHADAAADAVEQLRGYMMPPPRKRQPTRAQREQMTAELTAALDRLDRLRPPFAGPAPVRRLNRAEYRNAVRDLIGIDVELSTEFPADDTAHGFDNVADALSLSPMLLEKYLSAAEEVLGKLAVPDPHARALELDLAGACLEGPRSVAIDGDAVNLNLEQEVATSLDVPQAGEYEVVARVSRSGPGADPATLALKLDGVDVKARSVYAPPDRPADVSATLRLPAGPRRLTLRHTWYTAQVDKGSKPPEIRARIESLAVRGPLPLLARRRVFFVDPADGVRDRDAAGHIVERFAARAFRRPLTAGELSRLLALYDRARAAGRSHDAGVFVTLASVLVSPHFLFHVARDESVRDAHGAYQLNDWELASRLAFFLWSAPPDDALHDLAAAGRLQDESVLRGQVRRMLADPKASALAENFGLQWLGVRRLETATFDRALFPRFGDELRRAMGEEVRLFFQTVVDEDREVGEFLTADWTWLNEDLARVYGLRGIRGGHMRRVTLADPNRGGVLTMPAILAVTSHPTRTSAVKRGKWVLDEILGAPPPPPPPNVPELPAPSSGSTGDAATYRQRMERHRADPRCFGCHVQMDTLGLGLENFDPIGRWRDRDAGRPIDPAGTLPDGAAFRNPAELKQLLRQRRDDFLRCLTEKMFVYALGRGVQRQDRREVRRIAGRLADDGRFSTLVTEIVLAYPFRYRQADPVTARAATVQNPTKE